MQNTRHNGNQIQVAGYKLPVTSNQQLGTNLQLANSLIKYKAGCQLQVTSN